MRLPFVLWVMALWVGYVLSLSGALTNTHRREKIPADPYRLRNTKKRAAILLTHGIIEAGKDDPRLIRVAWTVWLKKSIPGCGITCVGSYEEYAEDPGVRIYNGNC